MREADLADEFELRVFAEGWDSLRDLKHTADDVVRGVAKGPETVLACSTWSSKSVLTRSLPEVFENVKGIVDLRLLASLDHCLDLDRVRTVDNTEDIVPTDEPETCRGRLQVVNSLAHVSFSTEDKGSYSVVAIFHILCLANLV